MLDQRAKEAAAQGAASGAPSSASGGLAPHRDPNPSPPRRVSSVHERRYQREGPRAEDIRWNQAASFKIALDWHGVLDRLVDKFGVLETRPLQVIASLDSRELPVEYIVLSFAGHERSTDLAGQLQLFVGDAVQRGLPISGYRIVRERVGPGGKSDSVAALGIHCLIDDTDYTVNEVSRTGALTFNQHRGRFPTDWVFWLENQLRDWKGSLEALCTKYRAVKLRPEQYSQDPKKSGRR